MIRTRVRSRHEAAVLDDGTITASVLKGKTLLCIRTPVMALASSQQVFVRARMVGAGLGTTNEFNLLSQ